MFADASKFADEKTMIDRATIDRIVSAAKIEEVVSDFVTLKKSGVNYKGLCPFHDDTTPSFTVSPAKNICHCFACGKGGTPISFVMEHLQVSYPEALRYLAKKYNIEIEEREMTEEDRKAYDLRESMFVVNDWAQKWFRNQLHETVEGRSIGMAYFRERGFRDDIIEKFQLGYCPDQRDAMWQASKQEGYNGDVVLATGLCIKNESSKVSDRFRGRVIFPIHKDSGKVVGFGGRVLASATKGVSVKYQNSPESDIYSKKRELYGLFFAKKAIQKADACFLVEGYTDVMAMHQSGVENVVASSGTALTYDQIRMIHRLTENIVVIYDGDAAGIKASQRGIDMLLEQGMNVKLLLLPDEEDPDSFSRKHTAKEFQQYLAEHQIDFIRFKTNILLQEAKNDPVLMSHFVDNIAQSISVIPNEMTRVFYIREISQMLNISELVVTRAVGRAWKQRKEEREKQGETQTQTQTQTQMQTQTESQTQTQTQMKTATDVPASIIRAERQLVQMIVRYAEHVMGNTKDEDGTLHSFSVIEFVQFILDQDNITFRHPLHQRIYEEALSHWQEEGFNSVRYFENFSERELAQFATQLAMDQEFISKIFTKNQALVSEEERLSDLMPRLVADYKLAIVDVMLKDIKKQMTSSAQTADKEQQTLLMKRFMELKEVHKELCKLCGERVYGA